MMGMVSNLARHDFWSPVIKPRNFPRNIESHEDTVRKFQMIVGKTVRFPKLSCWHHWKADVKLDRLEK